MIRSLIAALLFIASSASAQLRVDAVGVVSSQLGYENGGGGLRFSTTARRGDWGWDGQATALYHPKISGRGYRVHSHAMGRRHIGAWFLEAGARFAGYESLFPDGREWRKFGWAPGVGAGRTVGEVEWTARFFFPNSTINKTSVATLGFEVPLSDGWNAGATIERWTFDIYQERRSGHHIEIRFGRRF